MLLQASSNSAAKEKQPATGSSNGSRVYKCVCVSRLRFLYRMILNQLLLREGRVDQSIISMTKESMY